jgi:hypothetical protein
MRKISNGTVATGACEKEGLNFFLFAKLGLSNIGALIFPPKNQVYQVPTFSAGLDLLSSEMVNIAHSLGQKVRVIREFVCVSEEPNLLMLLSFPPQIHYWVVNDEKEINKVWASGADAVVSDRCDLAKKTLIEYVLFRLILWT